MELRKINTFWYFDFDFSDLFSFEGVNVVKRKIAAQDNLKLTITQEGNKFTVKEASTFRNIEIVFELGVTFNYSLADGTEVNVRNFFKQCILDFSTQY
jgi:hypothetical protein